MMSGWARLDRAIVTWDPVDATHTRVSWRLEYKRLLNPSFYFGSLQRFGMSDVSDYLLDVIVVSRF